MSEKPDPDAPNPENEQMIKEARDTIGDCKLKANLQVDEDPRKRVSVRKKFQEIVRCRRKVVKSLRVVLSFRSVTVASLSSYRFTSAGRTSTTGSEQSGKKSSRSRRKCRS